MSPVSRGRQGKSGRKARAPKAAGRTSVPPGPAGRTGRGYPGLQALLGVPDRPEWFDAPITRILGHADVVLAAQGPRQLEQAAAELLGLELYNALRGRHDLWFGWLFEELATAAAAAVRAEAGRPDGSWEPPWRLLHGLTSIGSPVQRSVALGALARAKAGLPPGAAARQPGWLWQLPRIAATGEVWEMHDAYGTRFAVIAGFAYPGGTDPSVFLFDIDVSGVVELAGAGVYDDADQAAAAWRLRAGEAADAAQPSPVETAERLYCLAYLAVEPDPLSGSEPREVMDNWFRAYRRIDDLTDALRKRGLALPETKSLYQGIDTKPMTENFTAWYLGRHGVAPDPEAVGAVAQEWLEGALPGTWQAASPDRARFQLALISDWKPGYPITAAALALLPEWVRWNGEQAGLPGHLIDRAVEAARAPA